MTMKWQSERASCAQSESAPAISLGHISISSTTSFRFCLQVTKPLRDVGMPNTYS